MRLLYSDISASSHQLIEDKKVLSEKCEVLVKEPESLAANTKTRSLQSISF